MVKLSPNAADVRRIARAIADAGADAITAVNTLSGMALGPTGRGPFLGNTYGGLSGPALKPVALRVVYEVAQVVDIPIVAIGGVSRPRRRARLPDGRRVAVQVGTAVFADPMLPVAPHRRAGGVVRSARPRLVPSRSSGRPASAARPSAKGAEYRP